MTYVKSRDKKVRLQLDQESLPIQGTIPYTDGLTSVATPTSSTSTAAIALSTVGQEYPQLVLVQTVGAQALVRFGTSAVAAAAIPTAGNPTTGIYLASGKDYLISLPPGTTHFRAIDFAGTPTVYVTAIGAYSGSLG